MKCPLFEAFLKTPHHPIISTDTITLSIQDLEMLVQDAVEKFRCFENQTIQLKCPLSEKTWVAIFALFRLRCKIILLHPKSPIDPGIIIDPLDYHFQKKELIKTFETQPGQGQFFFKTSGSTGSKKLIAHAMDTIINSAISTIGFYKMHHNTYQLNLPINHVGGFMIFFRMLLSEGTVLMQTQKKADFYSMVPTQLYRLFYSEMNVTKHYEDACILVGGAMISNELINLAKAKGIALSCTYGMTEMASQITAGSFRLGHPLPHKELSIQEDGEIAVKGNSLFLGYGLHCEPPKTQNGFFLTKDLGKYDPTQGLQFIGRKDRLIIKGGENIHPENIELKLYKIQELQSVICIGIPDEEYGQKIACFIHPFNSLMIQSINVVILEEIGKFFLIDHFFPYPTDLPMKPTKDLLLSLAKKKDVHLSAEG